MDLKLSADWNDLENGASLPKDELFCLVITESSPFPIPCIYQCGEPFQVVISISKKTVTTSFKPIKQKVLAWRSNLGFKIA